LRDDAPMAESQLSELRNMRVRLEDVLGQALDEVDHQIEELRKEGRG